MLENGKPQLNQFFQTAVHNVLNERMGWQASERVEQYLSALLTEFLHRDAIYAIKDSKGQPLECITDMLAEGDILQNADSFERERQVHKHLGDFLLFWSGIFPESLDRIAGLRSRNRVIEAIELGSYSYSIVASFDHKPFDQDAPTFHQLSQDFEILRLSLQLLRDDFPGFAA